MAGSGEDPKRAPAVPTFGPRGRGPLESQPGTETPRPTSATVPPPADLADTVVGPPTARPSTPAGPLPERIGPFEVVEKLARGGMGVIWVARRPGLDRRVALKQMRADDGPPRPSDVQRFLDEARLAARLQHPNIVRILEVGEENGLPWFAMELIDGENLETRVKRAGPLPGREAARMFEKLARALAYAHAQRLLHRDLKPANVLLDRAGGEPVITDFGLVRALDEDKKARRTQEGELMGTPAYMPPEQAEGALDRIDQRADVYSLGATLYEAITGRLPFEGKTTMSMLNGVLTKDPPPPSKLVPGIDRDLETIVLRCLEKDPLRRYPGATALADDLGRFARDEPIAARRATAGERAARWVRRNRALAASGAGLLVCLFLGVPAAALWILHTRAEAAAMVEAERGKLALAARDEARAALAGIAIPDSGLPRGDREQALDVALGKALRASRAAEQWRLLTPEDEQAVATAVAAARRLADVAAEGEQWATARQALDQARDAGLDDAAHARAVADLEARRDATLVRRKAEVDGILAEVERGGPGGAVLRLLRYGEPELVQHMCQALDRLTRELTEAEVLLYESVREPGEGELAAIVRGRAAGTAPEPDPAARLLEAERRFLERAGRGARDAVTVVARAQAEQLGGGQLEVAGVLCEALGAIGDRRAAGAVARHVLAEASEARAVRAARGLLLLGGDEAPRALTAAGSRFPPGGPLAALREGRDPSAEDADRRLVRSLDPCRDHADPASVEAALERLLRARADEPMLLARRSWLRAARGELALAQADAELASRGLDANLIPGDPGAEEHGWAWLFLARTFTALGDEARARRYAAAGVELLPHAVQGFLVRGDLLKDHEPMEAVYDLERAVERAPGDLQVQALRAFILAVGGNYSEAVRESRRLVVEAPGSSMAWAALALTQNRQGLEAQAIEAADKAVALDPRNLNGHRARMFARAGVDPAGALQAGETILARRPGSYPTLFHTARLLERLDRLDEALARCQACLAIGRRDPTVLTLVARVHRKSGRLAEARRQQAGLAGLDLLLTLIERASLLRDEGDRDGARRELLAASARLDRFERFEREELNEWAALLLELGPPDPATLPVVEAAATARPDLPLLALLRGAQRLAEASRLLLAGDRTGAIEAFRKRAGEETLAAVFAGLLAREPALVEPHVERPGWDGLLARAALGRVEPAELLAAAEAEGAAVQPWRRCQARVVLGLRAEAAGDAALAREHYQAAAQEGVSSFERAFARSRLG